jgi:integrase
MAVRVGRVRPGLGQSACIAPPIKRWADSAALGESRTAGCPLGTRAISRSSAAEHRGQGLAAGADHEYVAAQIGHEDVTTTNRIYRYVLQRRRRGEIGRRRRLPMHESVAGIGRSEPTPADLQQR